MRAHGAGGRSQGRLPLDTNVLLPTTTTTERPFMGRGRGRGTRPHAPRWPALPDEGNESDLGNLLPNPSDICLIRSSGAIFDVNPLKNSGYPRFRLGNVATKTQIILLT
jgi:hypothetical protein